jgi:hypothetical protein
MYDTTRVNTHKKRNTKTLSNEQTTPSDEIISEGGAAPETVVLDTDETKALEESGGEPQDEVQAAMEAQSNFAETVGKAIGDFAQHVPILTMVKILHGISIDLTAKQAAMQAQHAVQQLFNLISTQAQSEAKGPGKEIVRV